jgi:apolipoprotein D and lipocalin family protein
MRTGLLRLIAGLWLLFLLPGCSDTGVPDGVTPVRGFEPDRYLGKWYEIVRLDHSFERGLQRVTAEYGRRDDGGIDVINRGYNPDTGAWEVAHGRAYFLRGRDVGSLKVSFFGPFYGGYHVITLDKRDYAYAMVSGPDRGYLWVLARTPELDEDILAGLIERARELGYPVEELIRVRHRD